MACMLFLIFGSYQPNAYVFLYCWNYTFRVRVLQVELVGPKGSVCVALIDVIGFTSLPFPAVHEHTFVIYEADIFLSFLFMVYFVMYDFFKLLGSQLIRLFLLSWIFF